MRKCPNAQCPHSRYRAFSPPTFTHGLMGGSDDQLTEDKTQAWFTDGSAWHAGTTQKWTAAALSLLSETDTGEGKSSQGQIFKE